MENYEIVSLIGKGNFGSISKIRRIADGKILVWKELNYGKMDEKERRHIISEVNILRELHHPHIVKYYDKILDRKRSRLYIIMEYCPGGDLSQLIKRCRRSREYIAEDIICKIFTQIVLAVYACHNFKNGKILHRDIKLSNVFLDAENNVKLGDFGLSKLLSNESNFAYSNVGTPYYMSPEQVDENRYNEKCDIWSLGCLLYEITCLRPPFEATNHLSLALKIKAGKVERIPNMYSDELYRVIIWMMKVNAEHRPTIEDIVNLPQVSMRIRERKIKENYNKMKILEENVKQREINVKKKEMELKLREEYLDKREKMLIERESKFNRELRNFKQKQKLNKDEIRRKSYSLSSLHKSNIGVNNYNININSNVINNEIYNDTENGNEGDNREVEYSYYKKINNNYNKQTPPISPTSRVIHKSLNTNNKQTINSTNGQSYANSTPIYSTHHKTQSSSFNNIISTQSTSKENSNNNNLYSPHVTNSFQNEYHFPTNTISTVGNINNTISNSNNPISMHSYPIANNSISSNMNMNIYNPISQPSNISTPKRSFGFVMTTPGKSRYSPMARTPKAQENNIVTQSLNLPRNNSYNITQMINTSYKKKNSCRNNSSCSRAVKFEKIDLIK